MKCVIKNRTVYKKSKRGTYRAVVKYYDERGTLRIKEFENKKKSQAQADAEVFITKLQEYNNFDIINPKAKEDFSKSIKEWYINFKRDTLKRSAQDTFESTMNNHIIPEFSGKAIVEIDANTIQNMINMKKQQYSHSTVKKIYNILNQFYNYLYKNQIIVYNPISSCDYQIHKSKIETTKLKIFQDEEIKNIKEIINSKNKNDDFIFKDAHIFILILNTGLREGEALALKNSDIDLDNNTLTVNKEVREVRKRNINGDTIKGTENIITTPKSENSNRTIPLTKDAIKSIKILQKNSPNKNDYLIHDSEGKYLSENALRKRFKRILDKAGIKDKSIHTLRHTFATKLFCGVNNEKSGNKIAIPIETVSRILGHSSIQTTEKIYVHPSKKIKVDGFENITI